MQSILAFSHDLGAFYGRWHLAQTGVGADSLMIYITNASGVLGPPVSNLHSIAVAFRFVSMRYSIPIRDYPIALQVETGRTSAAEPPFSFDPTDFISEYQVARNSLPLSNSSTIVRHAIASFLIS